MTRSEHDSADDSIAVAGTAAATIAATEVLSSSSASPPPSSRPNLRPRCLWALDAATGSATETAQALRRAGEHDIAERVFSSLVPLPPSSASTTTKPVSKYLPAFVVEEMAEATGGWAVARTSTKTNATTNDGDSDGDFVPFRAAGGVEFGLRLHVIGRPEDLAPPRRQHEALFDTLAFAAACVAHLWQLHHRRQRQTPADDDVVRLTATCILCRRERGLPPRADAPLDAEHINGGVTNLATRRILVYRAQHAHKVLIHEVIHALGLDDGLRASPANANAHEAALCAALAYAPSPDVGLRANEAYVETLACWWHAIRCLWPSRLQQRQRRRGGGGRDIIVLEEQLAAAWERERELYDAVSVLLRARASRVSERTHALAYYHAKAALWKRLDRVPAWPRLPKQVDAFWAVLVDATIAQIRGADAATASAAAVSRRALFAEEEEEGRLPLMTGLPTCAPPPPSLPLVDRIDHRQTDGRIDRLTRDQLNLRVRGHQYTIPKNR